MSAAVVAWLLGLSFVSDFIKRHAVRAKRGQLVPLTKWIQWGTRETGWITPSGVEEWVWFFRVRVPGVYWEPYYEYARDRSTCVWCHKWLYWASKSAFDSHMLHGWHEHFVPIEPFPSVELAERR